MVIGMSQTVKLLLVLLAGIMLIILVNGRLGYLLYMMVFRKVKLLLFQMQLILL